MTLANRIPEENNLPTSKFGTKVNSMWLAQMSDGHRITRDDYILSSINQYISSHPSVTLIVLSWIQNGIRWRLNYVDGTMWVGTERINWPQRLVFDPIRPLAFKSFAMTLSVSPSPSPSPNSSQLRFVGLGLRITIVHDLYLDMYVAIYPDDTWSVEITTPAINPALVNAVSGVLYWKIFYDDATVITKQMMNFEDAPTENVQVIILFFGVNNPAYPRARIFSHDYYWKDGDLWGFSHTDINYTRGHVKTGSLVSNRLWKWIMYATKRDYTADGYTHPSPQW